MELRPPVPDDARGRAGADRRARHRRHRPSRLHARGRPRRLVRAGLRPRAGRLARVEDAAEPLGYALLDDRGAALVTVPPATEGRGVGTLLREAAEARAIERGEALVRQYVPITNEPARAHLLEAGYWPAFSYFRMRMALADVPPPPDDVPVRPFDRGIDDVPVHALVEDAFAAIPGNVPQSLESWQAAKVDKAGLGPALWLAARGRRGPRRRGALRALGGRRRATSTRSRSRRACAAGPRPRDAPARPRRAARRRA